MSVIPIYAAYKFFTTDGSTLKVGILEVQFFDAINTLFLDYCWGNGIIHILVTIIIYWYIINGDTKTDTCVLSHNNFHRDVKCFSDPQSKNL